MNFKWLQHWVAIMVLTVLKTIVFVSFFFLKMIVLFLETNHFELSKKWKTSTLKTIVFLNNHFFKRKTIVFWAINFNIFWKDKVIKVVFNVFLSQQITWMSTDLGLSDQKMHFLFKRSLTIVNKVTLLSVVLRKGRFQKRPFLEKWSVLFKTKNYRFWKQLFIKNDNFKKLSFSKTIISFSLFGKNPFPFLDFPVQYLRIIIFDKLNDLLLNFSF